MNGVLYLDTRREKDGQAPLRYIIRRGYTTSFLSLGISIPIEYWDKKSKQICQIPKSKWPEGSQVRNFVQRKVTTYDTTLLKLEADGALHSLDARQIKELMEETLNPKEKTFVSVCDCFRQYIEALENKRTKEIYTTTLNKIRALEEKPEKISFEDVTCEWIRDFDHKLKDGGVSSENARSIHLRNLRAVHNHAIRQGYTETYPWKNYKIKKEETEKRSLTVEELRTLLNEPCSKTKAMYRDYFKLIFLLIGINHADLCDLKDTDLRDGRIYYERKKTHRKYNIKVEPEAMELIRKYKGKDWLIDIHDRYRNTHDQLKHFNPMLASIIDRPPFDELTTYWARHTWATIAYNDLDISIDTISAALGHQYGSRVTAVYINPDQKRVDQANRRVIDWVFYGKR